MSVLLYKISKMCIYLQKDHPSFILKRIWCIKKKIIIKITSFFWTLYYWVKKKKRKEKVWAIWFHICFEGTWHWYWWGWQINCMRLSHNWRAVALRKNWSLLLSICTYHGISQDGMKRILMSKPIVFCIDLETTIVWKECHCWLYCDVLGPCSECIFFNRDTTS